MEFDFLPGARIKPLMTATTAAPPLPLPRVDDDGIRSMERLSRRPFDVDTRIMLRQKRCARALITSHIIRHQAHH